MADQLILLTRGDGSRGQAIIDAFAQRTGLQRRETDGGAAFPLEGEDHRIQVVQTLTEIDPDWAQHVALGDPQSPLPDP